MPRGPSPFAVLGLHPGATRAELDETYRRLIKQHHPDRPGGDPQRAAELNHAYAVLKRERLGDTGRVSVAAPPPTRRRGGRRVLILGALLAAGGSLMLVPLPDLTPPVATRAAFVSAQKKPDAAPAMADTLELRSLPDSSAVTSGVAEAVRLIDSRPAEAAAYSRSCNDDLRRYPGAALLDHCVAFDTAAASLSPDASRHAEYSPEVMAQRHVEAALLVSNDPILAEDRIAQVRRDAGRLLVMMQEANAAR